MARRRKQSANVITGKSRIRVNDQLTITMNQHNHLLDYITTRLNDGKEVRDQNIDVYRYIDREYYGYLLRNQDDQKRLKDAIQGKSVKPVDEKLSLIFAQIDEAVTFLLSVLAPDRAIYSAIAPEEQQRIASGFAALMNRHAQFFDHYGNYALFLVDALRYNLGAFGTFWKEHRGNEVVNDQNNRPTVKRNVLLESGNEIEAFDPYNLLYDASVSPVDLASRGEFFSTVHLYNEFTMKRMVANQEIFNYEQFLEQSSGVAYYETHPEVRSELRGSNTVFDWVKFFMARAGSTSVGGFEIPRVYMWVVPNDHGLGDSKEFEVWRFLLGSDKVILHASPVDNAHGFLPINAAIPFDDHMTLQTKSVAERLIPYQRFGSFSVNVHQRAERKRLTGLTIYDAHRIPALANENADLEGGKIPFESNGQDVDVNKIIKQFIEGPDTQRTLENLGAMNDIMQNVLPTQILQQVAGLDRATQYQAAATVQGANRRNLKIARIINAQAMERARLMQMYNIFQFQDNTEILDQNGKLISIVPREFRDTRIEFTIDDGLKGIDKLSLQINMKEMFNMVLQSQQAAAQTDVMALMNYLTSLFGDYTDFSQFKLESPMDALPKEQRDLAFQLLQQLMQQQEQKGGRSGNSSGGGAEPVVRGPGAGA